MKVIDIKLTLGKELYVQLKKEKVPLRYIKFAAEYLTNNFNATQAYLKSVARKGTKVETASSEAVRVIGLPKVKAAIKIIFDSWLGEKKLKLERKIIDRLYAKAFYDPFLFINSNGSPKFDKIEDIPEEWRCCIEGIETKYYGKNADVKVITVKLADQNRALLELSKYIALYKESDISELKISDETVNRLSSVFGKKK